MQPVPFRTVDGLLVISNPFGTTTGSSLAKVEKLSCTESNPGDFKRPTAFFFRLHRQYGDPYRSLTEGYYNLAGYSESVQADFRVWEVDFGWDSDPADVDWARVDDRCLEKIFDQLRGNSNLIVDFAEGGSTIKMISNLRKLRKEFIKTVVSTKKSKRYKGLTSGQQRLDYLTSKWLEVRYGWMPLIYSTYDALDTLGRRFQGGLFPVGGRSGVTIEDTTTSGDGTYQSPTVKRKRILRYRTEMNLQFRLPVGNQLYDWTSLNPVGIAWELTPLSFVADWFVNIGDLLSLWENYFIFANKFERGYKTRSYSLEVITTVSGLSVSPIIRAPNGDPYDQTYSQSVAGGDRVYKKYMNREVLQFLPSPSQGVRFKPNLNAKRLLDAASLLHVLTKSAAR